MIGIDIVEIERIRGMLEKYGEHFLEKVFAPAEIGYARGRKRREEFLAGRFAAKEAFMKAWGKKLVFREIEVNSNAGRPYIVYQGNHYDSVSISHERSYAISVVILKD